MAKKPEKVTRATLAKYAGLLGRASVATLALHRFDVLDATGGKPTILMHNNGFTITEKGGQSVRFG